MSHKISDLDIPLFDGLSEQDLDGILPNLAIRSFNRWEMIINQSDNSRDVYFLISGSLLAMFFTEEGRELIFSQINPGEYFGELSALDGGQRSLAVLARSRVKVAVMSPDAFSDMMDRMPQVRRRVVRDLTARIRSLTNHSLKLTTFSVEQRVVSYVASLALDRDQFKAGGIIEDAPTHAEIGAMIGSNREMISRIMSRLSQQGILRTARKRIEILDPLGFEYEI